VAHALACCGGLQSAVCRGKWTVPDYSKNKRSDNCDGPTSKRSFASPPFFNHPVFNHKSASPYIPLKTKQTARAIPAPTRTPMLLSSSNMERSTDSPPLSSVQQCVVDALAAGSTLTDAAEAYSVHRVTIYRWMKTCQPFSAALHRARAEFVLARRDDLHQLSNRALETLLAILDNPKSSPAVLLRTAVFILQRPQMPKTGWSMPEPAPDPDGEKLLDSAIIEQDYDRLPGLCNIEADDPAEAPPQTETPPETSRDAEVPSESAASEPLPSAEMPVPPPSDAAPCNRMQHDFQNCDAVASAIGDPAAPSPAARRQGLRSCPVPADVLAARNEQQQYVELLDMIESIEQTPIPKIEKGGHL
jgi:hypothetical protein